MVQPIYLYGSDVLRQKASEADLSKKDEIKDLVQDLRDTLVAAEGCGLAAPQIGVSRRVVIVDGTVMAGVYAYLKDFKRTLINPVIIEESRETCEYNEGCLSIPDIYADVSRPVSMVVEYYNEDFKKVTEGFDRFACRMVQHELSHLDGDMFTDHVTPIRKKLIAKKLANIAGGRVAARYKTRLVTNKRK